MNAHYFSSHNRTYLEKDCICGYFYCLKNFHPIEIVDNNNTAICPHCGMDSIIGEGFGFQMTELFKTNEWKIVLMKRKKRRQQGNAFLFRSV
ncbi:hypothetical protein ACUC2M_07430 [Bacillus cytotoxicus]